MGRAATITRRTLLVGTVAVTGGFAVGYWQYKKPHKNPLLANLKDDQFALTPYVQIDQKGVTLITPRAEMGQGIHTTLAALIAEELDVELDAVAVAHGPASKAYYNTAMFEEGVPYAPTDVSDSAERARRFMRIPAKFLAMQVTGGSSSVPDGYFKMRQAGAAARHVLLQAAAELTNVPIEQLSTSNGAVALPDGARLNYSELAQRAAQFEPPQSPTLKPSRDWRLLGRSLPRVDVVAKSTGTAEYSIDVELPGMLYATVLANPHLGAALNSFDASAALAMRGIDSVVDIDNGVAVLATNTWYALKAARAIDVDWADADYPVTHTAMLDEIAASFTEERLDSEFRNDGDVERLFAEADVIDAEYRVPFLAHATMEPMNATAWLQSDRLDVWAGTQFPTQVVEEAEAITGLDAAQIHVHTTLMGGGFGRRSEMDFVKQAIQIAKARPGVPIKTTWSREEDITHDFYRPAAVARFRGAAKDGVVHGFALDAAALSVAESQFGRYGINVPGPDATIVQGAWEQPYAIQNYRVRGYRAPAMLPVSSWRAVGASQNGFFHESAMDELARAAGRDPLELRLDLIDDSPSLQVLEAVASLSNWSGARPEGHGLGIAFVHSFGVPTAEVVEVVVEEDRVRILNVYAAVDVGVALDPRNIEAQVQSGINFGLAAAMHGEVTIEDGEVQQTNFHQYDGLRTQQAPKIHVKILENNPKVRGIGEPGLPPIAPALANAIAAATGRRIRELPLSKFFSFV